MTLSDKPPITPQMKVGEFLAAFPELEDILIEFAPAFKKLRSPVLRRTVARVTSLSQAARVGGVSLSDLILKLRQAAGQSIDATVVNNGVVQAPPVSAPSWLDMTRIHGRLDARPIIEAGQHPIGQVLSALDQLPMGGIFELTTPFEPAPLIDKAKAKGFDVYSTSLSALEWKTYFTRGSI